jgi:hypothetical protein
MRVEDAESFQKKVLGPNAVEIFLYRFCTENLLLMLFATLVTF